MPSILIGGDVCPMGPNEPLFQAGRANAILGDLMTEFERADFRVVNLECPLVAASSPIRRVGHVLGVSRDCVNGLKAVGVNAVNLANNHILDHGEAGVRSTVDVCARAGIDCFGAGPNLVEAGKVLIREVEGARIGFFGVAERESSIAGAGSWGANPIDVIEVARALRRVRADVDFLVVLVHGGAEHYQYPTPGLRKLCRFIIEEGAGAVVCQHSHCPGCYEFHGGAPIVYGQGNLVFHRPSYRASWHEGFLVRLTLKGKRECSAEWVPFLQSPDKPGVERMPADREREFLNELARRAREMQEDGFVERKWAEFCEERKSVYEGILYHRTNWLPRAMRRLHLSEWLYSDESRSLVRNAIRCETHREALLTILGDGAETTGSHR